MMMSSPVKALATILASGLISSVSAKAMFAHYMLGGIREGSDHAERDVQDALNVGIDAFAVNFGATPGWAITGLDELFDAADNSDLKLFFSLDLYQENDIYSYRDVINKYKQRPSYLRQGEDDDPVISTFSSGTHGPDAWAEWKWDVFGDNVYFIPNADTSPGYNNPDSWMDSWGNVVDGVFGWETAWSWPGNSAPINKDRDVQDAARAAGKTYMAPLSPFQFKECCGANRYRVGADNLPRRMEAILDLSPDFVEFITWNDAGESHYMGNIWPETNIDSIERYANTDDWPHYGWQSLVASFADAYKHNRKAGAMRPQNGADVDGAMWYHPLLSTAGCGGMENLDQVEDAVNYGFVVAEGVEDLRVRIFSGDTVIHDEPLSPGLNYASASNMKTGWQGIEVVRGSTVVGTAGGKVQVSGQPGNCFFNYQVSGFDLR